jgi:branched-chain amino acid transport system ATP-binding protein
MIFRPEAGGPDLDLTRAPAEEIVAAGLSHCPEGRQIFSQLTVRENLRIGAYLRRDEAAVKKDLDWICSLFPILAERLAQRAGTLSGGEQMMLAIGRALMSRPRLLLMDEPSLGLAPLIVEQIFEILARLNEQGVTLLLVEQNAQLALELAQRAYVLETGRITLSGTGRELADNELVRRAYLGTV